MFLMNTFNIPSNKSKIIRVPKLVASSSSAVKAAFLRGLADTDFSMTFKRKYRLKHYYPVIHAAFASGQLVNDVSLILDELGFSHYVTRTFTVDKRTNRPQETFHIFISGKDNFDRWFGAIGSSNPKHLNKYIIWKRFGYYPPYMTHVQRVAMIAENKVGRE